MWDRYALVVRSPGRSRYFCVLGGQQPGLPWLSWLDSSQPGHDSRGDFKEKIKKKKEKKKKVKCPDFFFFFFFFFFLGAV